MQVSQLMYRLNDDSDADSGSKLQSDTDDGVPLHLFYGLRNEEHLS